MNREALLSEDYHVHSTFSDGANSVEDNIRQSELLGLSHLGCVDHVRRDSSYLSGYLDEIESWRTRTPVRLTAGIEAKIMSVDGSLDLPDDTKGVDLVYVADHQYPWDEGPVHPRVVRDWISNGNATSQRCIDSLVNATINAMTRNASRHSLVLAHLFSILPKVGLSENDVTDAEISRIARGARDSGTVVEISERWRCPSARVMRAMKADGVKIVCSTDSHSSDRIGRYDYVSLTLQDL